MAKAPSGSNRSTTAVSSTCRLTFPNSQIRLPVEIGIKDQAQIFNLGAQCESAPAYASKEKRSEFYIFYLKELYQF